MRAARSNPDILNILVQYGADINCLDVSGDTDLHKALRNLREDCLCVVERLLSFGANINLPNSNTGITPLILSIEMNSPQTVIELLLLKGANPHCRDRKGRNALHCSAKMANLWALSRLLQESIDLESKWDRYYRELTAFEYLLETCRQCFALPFCRWKKPYSCLRAMNILMKAGAKLSSGGDTDLVEVLQWFREQAEMIYQDPNRTNISRPVEMEEKHIGEIRNIVMSLISRCSNGDTLRHLCRLKIRLILKSNFRERLQMLHLPGVLYDYILMKDLLFSEPWIFWNNLYPIPTLIAGLIYFMFCITWRVNKMNHEANGFKANY